MEYQLSRRGNLPACVIDASFMNDLWSTLSQEGKFIWNAMIGSGADLLGKTVERPQYAVYDWGELVKVLSSQNYDFLQITVEYPDKGTLSFVFRNYNPAGGYLIVAGLEQEWNDKTFDAIQGLFIAVSDHFSSKLYNRYTSFVVYHLIPLLISFVIVFAASVLLIPGAIWRGGYFWWIVAGTIVANLKLGQIISDRVIIYILAKYPYLRWRQ